MTTSGVFQASRMPPARHFSCAGFPVQRHQRLAFHAGVDEDQVLVQNGRSRRAPAAGLRADVGLPELVALVIEREHAGLAEKRVHPLGVHGHRVGREAVVADPFLFRQFGRHGLVPHHLAIIQPQGEQVTLELLRTAARLPGNEKARVAGQVDAIAEGDRARRPAPGSAVFQTMPWLWSHSIGRPVASEIPMPPGPRKRGQSRPAQAAGKQIAKNITEYATHRT